MKSAVIPVSQIKESKNQSFLECKIQEIWKVKITHSTLCLFKPQDHEICNVAEKM